MDNELRDFLVRLEQKVDGLGNGLQSLEDRMDAFEERMNGRMDAFEEHVNGRMDAFEERMNGRMDAFEERMNGRMDAFEESVGARIQSFEERVDARFTQVDQKLDAIDLRTMSMLNILTETRKDVHDLNTAHRGLARRYGEHDIDIEVLKQRH